MPLVLRRITLDDEQQVRAAAETMTADGGRWSYRFEPELPWDQYIALVRAREQDAGPDDVAHAELLADVDGTVVGRATIRLGLDDFFRTLGGQIGYLVLPAHRGRGHATAILRQSLVFLREHGIGGPVLVTCDDDNHASAAVIEKNGGVLESVVPGVADVPKRRYWID
ncbi:GNAT family N-acetyltransferase [Aeromicrobium sp. Root472D3]|uniref:GNAT family N-acetyltransferase n=1 Tax=Aeromicrobium sp. Root472D3 TaxID=1736540 RepID=UPI0009E7B349|nr:GNAT family N-acetyltransferase [Aeromicrobium sp. Root472D3]